jgi:6-phosphogluconolactonase (cycloisomerase 2 family)
VYRIDPATGAVTPEQALVVGNGDSLSDLAVDPTGRYLYAARFLGGILAYSIDPSTGRLSPIPGSPFAAGTGTASVVVDSTGQFVYATNASYPTDPAQSYVWGYRIDPASGALVLISGFPFTPSPGNCAYGIAVTP